MYGKMKEHLSQTLAEIKEAGLYKEERLIESAQQAAITVKGKEVLNFCANNHLSASSAERKIYIRNWKLLSLIISRQKTPFCMQPVSTPTEVCSNRFSRIRMPLSRIL